jgi:hypothetical protein
MKFSSPARGRCPGGVTGRSGFGLAWALTARGADLERLAAAAAVTAASLALNSK